MHGVVAEVAPGVADLEQYAVRQRLIRGRRRDSGVVDGLQPGACSSSSAAAAGEASSSSSAKCRSGGTLTALTTTQNPSALPKQASHTCAESEVPAARKVTGTWCFCASGRMRRISSSLCTWGERRCSGDGALERAGQQDSTASTMQSCEATQTANLDRSLPTTAHTPLHQCAP